MKLTKEECKEALSTIKYFDDIRLKDMFAPDNNIKDELDLISQLIDEHFKLVNHTTPQKPLWTYDDEPICPDCGEAIDAGNQDLCEFCSQRLDWSDWL